MGVFRATPLAPESSSGPSGSQESQRPTKRRRTAFSTTESDLGSFGMYREISQSGSHPKVSPEDVKNAQKSSKTISDAFVAANSAMRDRANPIKDLPGYSGLPYDTKDLSQGFSNYGSSSSGDKGKGTSSGDNL